MKNLYLWVLCFCVIFTACEKTQEQCKPGHEDQCDNPPIPTPTDSTKSTPPTTPNATDADVQGALRVLHGSPSSGSSDNDAASNDADHTEPDAAIQMSEHHLTCAIDRNQPRNTEVLLTDNLELGALPLTTWQERARACNAYNVVRNSGYEYTIVLIPRGRNLSPEQWIAQSHIGNQTPPRDIITPHDNAIAYLYTSTDLGIPKIYAMLWTENFALYIEWMTNEGLTSDELLQHVVSDHLIFEIPQDMREFLAHFN